MERPRRPLPFAPLIAPLLLGGTLVLALQEPDPNSPVLGLEGALAAVRDGGEPNDLVVELGRALFFDPLLSVDRTISCSSCHDPEHGFADREPTSTGVHGRRTLRNAPTLYNRALGESFMWDGRAATLEEQVLQPIVNELEMDLPLPQAVARLEGDSAMRAAFERAFGAGPAEDLLAGALAAYVRTLTYGGSPFDRFRRLGEIGAMTAAERAGMWIFESRAGCWRCHVEPNFTDEDFHATGVGARDGEPEPGRGAITGEASDRGRFKTPTLRGLTETAPYFHDGSRATLEEVVQFYREGGGPNSNLSPRLKPIDMTDTEAASLVAFLKALSRRPQ